MAFLDEKENFSPFSCCGGSCKNFSSEVEQKNDAEDFSSLGGQYSAFNQGLDLSSQDSVHGNHDNFCGTQSCGTSEGSCHNPHAITLHFILPNGEKKSVQGSLGSTVLEVAHHHDIDIEGACGGSLSCSTCHVVVEDSWFDQLPEATEDEEDMLDLAFDVTPTSRLCCQLILTPELNGLTLKVPEQTRHLVTMGKK